jgi:hypothetical protein
MDYWPKTLKNNLGKSQWAYLQNPFTQLTLEVLQFADVLINRFDLVLQQQGHSLIRLIAAP